MAATTIGKKDGARELLNEVRNMDAVGQALRKTDIVKAHDTLWNLCGSEDKAFYCAAMRRIVLFPEILWTIGRIA